MIVALLSPEVREATSAYPGTNLQAHTTNTHQALEVYFSRCLGFTLLTLGILTVLLTGSVPLSSSLREGPCLPPPPATRGSPLTLILQASRQKTPTPKRRTRSPRSPSPPCTTPPSPSTATACGPRRAFSRSAWAALAPFSWVLWHCGVSCLRAAMAGLAVRRARIRGRVGFLSRTVRRIRGRAGRGVAPAV